MNSTPMNKRGLSLLEAIVAIAILGVILAAVVPAFISYAQANQRSELKSGAVLAAQQTLDLMRRQQDGNLAGTHTVSSGTRAYNVTVTVCVVGTAGCLSTENTRHVHLEVKYAGTSYYSVETVFTRLD